jgi:glyoxylase-like metal-dependent hydrolase (beta-lactamase superfamily II)
MFAKSTTAEDRFAGVEIKTQKLTENIYMLVGAGGNIGISSGADGVLMIDDQYRPLAGKIKAALAPINKDAPTFLLNTHYHGDHTGGNIEFGTDSIIMAHENVRVRLINGNTSVGTPDHALPMITYTDRASIHFNDEEVALIHTGASHTDGDTMVHFKSSNVIHMGDNFFNKRFPYVDLGAGGSVEGLKVSIEKVLSLADKNTQIIPGHGELATPADLELKLEMINATGSSVKTAIAEGQTLEQIIAAGVEPKWKDWTWGFINEERWLTTLYNEYAK